MAGPIRGCSFLEGLAGGHLAGPPQSAALSWGYAKGSWVAPQDHSPHTPLLHNSPSPLSLGSQQTSLKFGLLVQSLCNLSCPSAGREITVNHIPELTLKEVTWGNIQILMQTCGEVAKSGHTAWDGIIILKHIHWGHK